MVDTPISGPANLDGQVALATGAAARVGGVACSPASTAAAI